MRTTIVLAGALLLASTAHAELAPGTTLDKTTAEQAKDLLPPEILAHYQKGDYVNPIVAWPENETVWPIDFDAATKANVGKYELGKEGHVVEKANGEQPSFIFGFPFPQIDAK